MKASRACVLVCVLVGLLAGTAGAVNIETVPVGNAGNAADTRYETPGYGSVGYDYRIGKYELTAGQYTAFLNAVAKTDTYGLYNTKMDTAVDPYGCNIKQTGTSGTYSYSVDADWANRPVNHVSWGDAARCANWLTKGQPGLVTPVAQDLNSTEDGSYFLNGAITDAALRAVTRKTVAQGGRCYIPSEDEWYKAAFYDPNEPGGAGYWAYPTGSNTAPGNIVTNPDPGNNANYYYYTGPGSGTWCIGPPYYQTEVGEFENSNSPYGTFDQAGNVAEWYETFLYGSYRGARGGSSHSFDVLDFVGHTPNLRPTYESATLGFRVVEVPEPATLLLLALGGLALTRRRR